jgi:hypothetical protein
MPPHDILLSGPCQKLTIMASLPAMIDASTTFPEAAFD